MTLGNSFHKAVLKDNCKSYTFLVKSSTSHDVSENMDIDTRVATAERVYSMVTGGGFGHGKVLHTQLSSHVTNQ